MLCQTAAVTTVPRETSRPAAAIFDPSNFYVRVGDHLEPILKDIELEKLSGAGRDLWTGGITLALITFFQYLEDLTDAQAVEAVRSRTEWKYALHLPIEAPAFTESALCDFRQSLVDDPACQCQFQKLIERLLELRSAAGNEVGHLEGCKLLFAVCEVNRLTWALEAMRQALEVLTERYPDWLRGVVLPHWYERYSYHQMAPISRDEPKLSLHDVGADIFHLFTELILSNHYEMNRLQPVRALFRFWFDHLHRWSETEPVRHTSLTFEDCDTCFHLTR